MFQFQTSAIKSQAEDISYETSTFCFNSKLVRLKVDYLGHLAFCGSDMFQFQIGAIKRLSAEGAFAYLQPGFNSKLVRLKDLHRV